MDEGKARQKSVTEFLKRAKRTKRRGGKNKEGEDPRALSSLQGALSVGAESAKKKDGAKKKVWWAGLIAVREVIPGRSSVREFVRT